MNFIFKKNYLIKYFVASLFAFIVFNFARFFLVGLNIVFLTALVTALALVALYIFFFNNLATLIQNTNKKSYYYILGITVASYLLSNLILEVIISSKLLATNILFIFMPLTHFYINTKLNDSGVYLFSVLLDIAFIVYLVLFSPIKLYLYKFDPFDKETSTFFVLTMILYVNNSLKENVSFKDIVENIVPPTDASKIEILKVWETRHNTLLELRNRKISLNVSERDQFKEFVKKIKYPIRIVHPTMLFSS